MNKGFTLLELLIVFALVIVIVAVSIPTGVNFYRSQTLDEATCDILAVLRRAQNQSVFQKNDSAFGVKFLSGSYVLFQGNSYALRTQSQDEVFNLPLGISISGPDEFVFSKLNGTSIPGTIIISSSGGSESININEYGKIEYQ